MAVFVQWLKRHLERAGVPEHERQWRGESCGSKRVCVMFLWRACLVASETLGLACAFNPGRRLLVAR